ncbi:MAG TPA: tRNA (adenosine(37)-N6)-threonylcarbamoyltransferase complex transferase subunit TsaD, partial [Armatimonadota bacterium]|nr:tRNA (adenosine(37)-N6)-threonylcarbamoyltransferase complex transferase subunit TsaD [Armatimonadota bacterium]
AAVIEDGKTILSNVVASQIDLFQRFGGVVPEVASRRHVELINPVVQQALDESNSTFQDMSAVAIINRPGLIPALIVGVSAAKAIAWAAGLPLIGVHHLEAHIYANFLVEPDLEFPFVCLIVSGGHSDIIYMTGHGQYKILARTRDDAAGEAFDKSARAMGLGYPGGPIIDKLAQEGNPKAVHFPRARVGDTLDFSFSGLKTAVVRYIEKAGEDININDVAASFQQAVVDVLVNNTMKAAQKKGVSRVVIAGGVAANRTLQKQMKEQGAELGIKVTAPPPKLCTDNAAMAAAAGYYRFIRGEKSGLDLDSYASEPLGEREYI